MSEPDELHPQILEVEQKYPSTDADCYVRLGDLCGLEPLPDASTDRALQLERDRLRRVLQSLSSPVFVISSRCDVEYLNPATEETFGRLGGRKCYDYFHGRSEECPWCDNPEVLKGRRVQRVWRWEKAGRVYEISGMPFPSTDGAVSKLVVLHEITELVRVGDALRESERQLRDLSTRLLGAQEEERKRIASELHDSIGSSLTAIKFSLENALVLMGRDALEPENIRGLIALTEQTIGEARRLMTDLRPSVLDDLGIVVTIGWFCRQFQDVYTEIAVKKRVCVSEEDVPEFLKIVIFRIIQEACHNIAKYSQAGRTSLHLVVRGDDLELLIEDDGVGFDVDLAGLKGGLCRVGMGLATMRERTELSGGRFTLESAPGKGTRIKASWPRGILPAAC